MTGKPPYLWPAPPSFCVCELTPFTDRGGPLSLRARLVPLHTLLPLVIRCRVAGRVHSACAAPPGPAEQLQAAQQPAVQLAGGPQLARQAAFRGDVPSPRPSCPWRGASAARTRRGHATRRSPPSSARPQAAGEAGRTPCVVTRASLQNNKRRESERKP